MKQLSGDHFVNGARLSSAERFSATANLKSDVTFGEATAAEVDVAARVAEAAFQDFAATSTKTRATLLRAIADRLDAAVDDLVMLAGAETALPEARLRGETARTSGQARLFAQAIEAEDYPETRHDAALPDRAPLPRPDLRLEMQPVGPVAVFGASNFPLAFSTAGGDTVSALAAGCPVVVKAHPAHPATSELVAALICDAVAEVNLPAGVFGMLQGTSHELGQALVQHPLITAVGFTGSLGAGRALYDLCAARPTPIPFFGELGSINPVFVLENALKNRGAEIAKDWAASLVMGAGQFCTNPGILVLPDGKDGDDFVRSARDALANVAPQTMLTEAIANGYETGMKQIIATSGVSVCLSTTGTEREKAPSLAETDAATFAANASLSHEVFGPFGLIVRTSDSGDVLTFAKGLDGQLTCTLQIDDGDADLARSLVPILARKAGRVLANGFPTGVEVAASMVHGGPYPASTNFGHTSVGTLAIRRWLRPVCFQNLPDWL